MGKVKFLSESIVSRIAAGEVVESPASVVKELIENSLDADAENIIIEIKSGGKKLISVKDDGEGIEPDDVEKLFNRHATSKIDSYNDLYSIKSLGFRGEALYSIGAVSDVLLQSRAKGIEGGGREIHIRGGVNIGVRDISRKEGTTVEVRELFFNTPARRKFLKSDTTEFRKIVNIIIPYTIAFPNKKFSLIHNGKNIFNFNRSEDIIDRFCEVAALNKDYVVSGEKEIKEKNSLLKVLLGDINLKFPVKNRQYIFVNNRPVYNRNLSYTMNSVYGDIFPKDIYPAFAVFIYLQPEDVDVNIHPSKREVKLKEEGYICSLLFDFSREILLKKARGKVVEDGKVCYEKVGSNEMEKVIPCISDIKQELFDVKRESVPECEGIRAKLKDACYIGSYKNKYLFFDAGETLLIMDQHAVHERIRFEILKRQWESGAVDIQRLLTPLIIKLSSEEIIVWEEGNNILEGLGFLTTRWDAHSIALHGFPQVIKNPVVSIRNILAERDFIKSDKETLARKACKGAVSAGDRITEEEAINIKNELLKCETPFVCPHGRPTVIEFSELFFDRQFLR
ncbi:MAG: DNA mismatch repair endonuclease MutL [bacterium]|nr:DNA mismatch repair endonuclease MutL [bacterium]